MEPIVFSIYINDLSDGLSNSLKMTRPFSLLFMMSLKISLSLIATLQKEVNGLLNGK